MALKFLNKKGWHTGNLRNIENVWKAEKKHDAEQKKISPPPSVSYDSSHDHGLPFSQCESSTSSRGRLHEPAASAATALGRTPSQS
ncbi:hypothetical protein RJ640_015543 [Escallonia rubra]|uniref:CBF1-interacting co-repressor CIR N-terminal domain-containing protein n=1 Tax=Escallonia rubra TaxID=112253 RepID=A0AA88QJ39_9ASTE|nr:hypothetical protein RJ640_015543 [Escallonia rubra]